MLFSDECESTYLCGLCLADYGQTRLVHRSGVHNIARARFVYDYALCKFTFIIIIIIIINVALLDDPLQSIPRQLAVPWYEVSRHVGVPPASSVANTSLNNWRLIDPDRHAALFVTSSVTAAASVSYNTIRYEVLF